MSPSNLMQNIGNISLSPVNLGTPLNFPPPLLSFVRLEATQEDASSSGYAPDRLEHGWQVVSTRGLRQMCIAAALGLSPGVGATQDSRARAPVGGRTWACDHKPSVPGPPRRNSSRSGQSWRRQWSSTSARPPDSRMRRFKRSTIMS